MPTGVREMGRERGNSRILEKEKREPCRENGCDNGAEMVSAYVVNEKKERSRNCKSPSIRDHLV